MVRRALVVTVCCVWLGACAGSWDSPARQGSSKSRGGTVPATGTYVVRAGDTFYAIAFRHGIDQKQLAKWNGISDPTRIYPGQKLRLTAPPRSATRSTPSQPKPPVISVSAWRWPTDGRLVASFDLAAKVKQTGVLISGQRGQPILAAAAGEVVYAGSGLKSYGKLIIIQHTPNYLSAYGHNSALLVNEGDQVRAGQKIATMGETPAQKPRLHFEVRLDGQPIDPMPLLRGRR